MTKQKLSNFPEVILLIVDGLEIQKFTFFKLKPKHLAMILHCLSKIAFMFSHDSRLSS